MIFSPAQIVAHLSQFYQLSPGISFVPEHLPASDLVVSVRVSSNPVTSLRLKSIRSQVCAFRSPFLEDQSGVDLRLVGR